MNISRIEGVGRVYAARLQDAGIKTTQSLLAYAGSRKGRQELARKAGVSETLILEWVNRADLMRIKGIGEEYSDLLEAAGVDTVRELGKRRSDNLYQTVLRVNAEKKLVRRIPSPSKIESWISFAKVLPTRVTH